MPKYQDEEIVRKLRKQLRDDLAPHLERAAKYLQKLDSAMEHAPAEGESDFSTVYQTGESAQKLGWRLVEIGTLIKTISSEAVYGDLRVMIRELSEPIELGDEPSD